MTGSLLASARALVHRVTAPKSPAGEAKQNQELGTKNQEQVPTLQSSNIDFFTASFEGASRWDGFRGYFWFPSLDPAVQMPSWSRETIAQKINWLYNNVGPVRAVVDGLSIDEVDTGTWPKATTSNPNFNRMSTDRFHEAWKDARFFDTRAVDDFYMGQLTVRRHIRLHGELFGQMVRPDDLNPFVRLHYVTMWQVRNAGSDPNVGFQDGIKSDPLGAAAVYRCCTGPDGEYKDVPSADMLHFHDAFWVGQKRGMSGLAAVAKKLFTMKEVEDAAANGVMLRSMVAYAIERKEGDTGGQTMIPGVVSTEEVETPDGGKLLVHKIVQRDNREITIAEPPAGRVMKTLDSSAFVEPVAFKKDILADVAYTSGYPPDYVFALASGSLGTEVRWKVRRVQRIINIARVFQLGPQYVEPLYRFRTWQDIKRGLYDGVKDGIPADWWKYKCVYPADTSVDLAREGKLLDDRFANNRMSPGDYFGVQGHDADDVDRENLELRMEREKKLAEYNKEATALGLPALTYEKMWPSSTQASANIAARSNDEPPPEPEDE